MLSGEVVKNHKKIQTPLPELLGSGDSVHLEIHVLKCCLKLPGFLCILVLPENIKQYCPRHDTGALVIADSGTKRNSPDFLL